MLHKLGEAMGKRDGEYVLAGRIEPDGGYFFTEIPDQEKDRPLKRGHGSQRKSKVMVLAESEWVELPTEGKMPRKAGYLKMKVIDNVQKATINEQVQKLACDASGIDTDDSSSCVDLKNFVPRHNAQVIEKIMQVKFYHGFILLYAMLKD